MQAISVRVLSAIVLAPPVVLAIVGGSPFVEALVLTAAVAMTWEGAHVVTGARYNAVTLGVPAAAAVSVGLAALGEFEWGSATVGTAALGVAAWRRRAHGPLLGIGLLYIAAACMAFLWVRHRPDFGLSLVAWVVAVVWATDVGAYIVGRRVGGWKLAPRISPGKTWAGLVGGVTCAAVVGFAVSVMVTSWIAPLPIGRPATIVAAAAALALISQGGDLLVSAFKRRFGVKDTSSLIPGHGGILDRTDGLLASSLAVALVVRISQGGS